MREKTGMPRFQLEKIYDGGHREEPELHRLEGLDPSCRMGRRGFLLTSALGAGALAALLPGCQAQEEKKEETQAALPELRVDINNDLKAHRSLVRALAFHPGGSLLASGSGDATVKFWSMPEGKLLRASNEYSLTVSALFTPDGELLVSCSLNNQIKLWAPPFAKAQTTLKARGYIGSFAISPDGKLLASISMDGATKLWELPSGELLKETENNHHAQSLAFTPDGEILACGEGKHEAVSLYSMPSGKLLRRCADKVINPSLLAFSPDGTLLAARGGDNLYLLEMPEGKTYAKLGEEYKIGGGPAFSPDGKWLAVGSEAEVLLLPKPFTRPGLVLQGHAERIAALAFSKDSRLLASGDDDGHIRVWEMPGEAPEDNPARLRAVLFDPGIIGKDTYVQYGSQADQSVFSGRCGDPLPAGATCACNCVSGRYSPPSPSRVPPSRPSGGAICTCDKICTCVPVK
ncbi:MAG: WD40 repeat domain-containing protein [Desulfovibrionaceae bacterium]|nr:WD40 repeat domain-containing protein [Desulfovibrionaceae bacterium]